MLTGMMDFLRSVLIQGKIGKSGDAVMVNRLPFYYEEYGHGEPLLMFHGGMSSLETFRFQISEFSKHYRVILPERRGHGRTPDTSGPYSYKQMAQDMAGFMREKGIGKARMVGYSDGANLLFHLAMDCPELIESCVLISGNFHYLGCTPEHLEELRNFSESLAQEQGVDKIYAKYSPDGPKHYWDVFQRMRMLWMTEPTFCQEDLKRICIPVLVMAGDHDIIRMDHTLELSDHLPNAQLVIVPGTTHRLIKEKPGLCNKAILNFFQYQGFEVIAEDNPKGQPKRF